MTVTGQLSAKTRVRLGASPKFVHERLESRQMFSVALNAAGFTVVTPKSTDRVIYCSSSTGNDRNTGLSPSQPVQTISRAETLLRNHTGDQLLLKAGDTWHTGFGSWKLSGASATEPMVIGAYGTGARPTVMTGTTSGITTGSAGAPEVDFLDIIGIHFWADGRDPSVTPHPVKSDPTGINILTKSNDILIEDCYVQDYTVNVNLQDYYGLLTNITLRRNEIVDSWSTDQHSQGLYALGVTNLTLNGNLFDHNGWNTQVAGAVATIYNHDCYISAHNSGVVVWNNEFARASATGLQDRPGGSIENNMFLDDPIGLTFGLVNGADTTPGGVKGDVVGNVFLGAPPVGTIAQGQAIQIGNIKAHSGTVIGSNVFASRGANAGADIELMHGIAQIDPQDSVGINDLTISYNVFYDATTGIDIDAGQSPGGSGLTALNRLSVTGNKFENITHASISNASASYLAQETWSGNTYYNAATPINGVSTKAMGNVLASPFAFSNPNRTIATFDTLISGPGTDDHFLHLCRLQSRATWSAGLTTQSVNSYITNGFLSKAAA